MVNDGTQKKQRPEYSLNRVRELARSQQVAYVGNTERDVANLSYSLSDVCDCLMSLAEDHFSQAIKYPDKPKWYDVYLVRYGAYGHCIDDLYIKLSLDRDCILIHLHSFHQQR